MTDRLKKNADLAFEEKVKRTLIPELLKQAQKEGWDISTSKTDNPDKAFSLFFDGDTKRATIHHGTSDDTNIRWRAFALQRLCHQSTDPAIRWDNFARNIRQKLNAPAHNMQNYILPSFEDSVSSKILHIADATLMAEYCVQLSQGALSTSEPDKAGYHLERCARGIDIDKLVNSTVRELQEKLILLSRDIGVFLTDGRFNNEHET
ncbi:MAG: hypothetical protein AB7H77_03795, partial [Bdellovibrionales bacterium]